MMKELLRSLPLFFLLSCASAPIPRDDPRPPASAWMELALILQGPDADRGKHEECIEIARESGIRIRQGAPARVVLTLGSPNQADAVLPDGQTRTRTMPGWNMKALCRTAFLMAVEDRIRPTIGKADPGPECQMLGSVDGADVGFFALPSYDAALSEVTVKALRMGTNYVALDAVLMMGSRIQLNGRGYRCEAPPPPDSPTPGACVPECSPGFTCINGTCVSACNPPCAQGQRCGADRICR